MKALRIYENAVVGVENIAEPIVNENSVKIKISACGICGSDIPRVLNGKAHFYPIILGHEFSGIVVGLGENVTNVVVGDHVTVAPLIPCKTCVDCKNGNYSLCKNYSFIGSRLNGAMAEYIVVPKENVIKLPKSINLYDAALIEPLTVVLHAFKQNRHKSNKKVAILGMGTIGILAVQVAKYYGVENITAVVRNHKYDNLLNQIGVDNIINTSENDWKNKVNIITDNRGYDMVYETAGSTVTIQQCFEIAANKAQICFIGTPKNDISFTVQTWEMINRKELYLTGSWMSYSREFPGDEWDKAVKLLDKQKVIIYPDMINQKVKLQDSSHIFDDYKNGGTVSGRKLIIMG